MPDVFGPLDAPPNGQAPWAQAQWYRDAYARGVSGVYGTPAASVTAGDLATSFNGFTWSVGLGRAHVRGMGYERTGAAATGSVDPNTSTTLQRIDRLVLRRDLAAKTCGVVRLQGTPASSPVAPTVQQVEDGQWDEMLCRFTVPVNSGTTMTGIVDERRWIDPVLAERDWPYRALGVNSGWSAVSGFRPTGQRIGPDRVQLMGRFSNNGAISAIDASQLPVQVVNATDLPLPKVDHVFVLPAPGGRLFLATMLATGVLRLDSQIAGSTSIPANTPFFLDGISYDSTWTGA